MTTPSHNSYSELTVLEPLEGLAEGGPHLDEYLQNATQELTSITEVVGRGDVVGHDSREWMLAQVDIIVEMIGNDSLEMSEEMRSNLLQLLLSIANLNEQIRRQTSHAL